MYDAPTRFLTSIRLLPPTTDNSSILNLSLFSNLSNLFTENCKLNTSKLLPP